MSKLFFIAMLYLLSSCQHSGSAPSFNDQCRESGASYACQDVTSESEVTAVKQCFKELGDDYACSGVTDAELQIPQIQSCLALTYVDHSSCSPKNAQQLSWEIDNHKKEEEKKKQREEQSHDDQLKYSRESQQAEERAAELSRKKCDYSVTSDQEGTGKGQLTSNALATLETKGYRISYYSTTELPTHTMMISTLCTKRLSTNCTYVVQLGQRSSNGIEFSYPVEAKSVEQAVKQLPDCKIEKSKFQNEYVPRSSLDN